MTNYKDVPDGDWMILSFKYDSILFHSSMENVLDKINDFNENEVYVTPKLKSCVLSTFSNEGEKI